MFMTAITIGTQMMSTQDTVVAILGIVLIALFLYASYVSRCLLRFHVRITRIKKDDAQINESKETLKEQTKTEEEK